MRSSETTCYTPLPQSTFFRRMYAFCAIEEKSRIKECPFDSIRNNKHSLAQKPNWKTTLHFFRMTNRNRAVTFWHKCVRRRRLRRKPRHRRRRCAHSSSFDWWSLVDAQPPSKASTKPKENGKTMPNQFEPSANRNSNSKFVKLKQTH